MSAGRPELHAEQHQGEEGGHLAQPVALVRRDLRLLDGDQAHDRHIGNPELCRHDPGRAVVAHQHMDHRHAHHREGEQPLHGAAIGDHDPNGEGVEAGDTDPKHGQEARYGRVRPDHPAQQDVLGDERAGRHGRPHCHIGPGRCAKAREHDHRQAERLKRARLRCTLMNSATPPRPEVWIAAALPGRRGICGHFHLPRSRRNFKELTRGYDNRG